MRGKHLLYAYCAERGVPHKRLGKLIVATDTAQAAQLEDIARRARANGVDDLQYISGEEAMCVWNRRCAAPPRCCRHPPASSTAMP